MGSFHGFPDNAPRAIVCKWVDGLIGYNPHPKQKELHDAVDMGAKYIIAAQGRQFGKTIAAAREILVEMAYRPRNMQRHRTVLAVAPLKEIGKRVFDYCYKWIVDEKVFGVSPVGSSDFLMYIKTPWNSLLTCKTTENPKALRGEGVTLCIMDEDAFMPDKENIMTTYIKPILAANNGRAIRISTPNGTDNHFYHDWHMYKELMKTDPDYYAIHGTSYDNPYLPDGFVDGAKKEAEMRGEDALREFRREWLAEWTCVAGAIFVSFKRSKDGKDWHVKDNLVPQEGAYIDVGLDFGHSSDHPLGLVFGTHWGNEVDVYKCIKGTVFRDCEIADAIKSTWDFYEKEYGCRRGRVFGDPSRDASLEELRFNDIFVYKGKKEVNDVKEGLSCLRNLFGRPDRPAIRIDSSCYELIKEIDNYQYKEDGIHPVKKRDDLVDALRYFAYGGTLSTARDLIWA